MLSVGANNIVREEILSNFFVRKAAVLGAGVMGAQIAAHLANAEVPVVLFDLPAKDCLLYTSRCV